MRQQTSCAFRAILEDVFFFLFFLLAVSVLMTSHADSAAPLFCHNLKCFVCGGQVCSFEEQRAADKFHFITRYGKVTLHVKDNLFHPWSLSFSSKKSGWQGESTGVIWRLRWWYDAAAQDETSSWTQHPSHLIEVELSGERQGPTGSRWRPRAGNRLEER